MKKAIAIMLMLGLVFLAAGCGSKKVTVKDDAGNKATVTSDQNKVEIKSDQGQLSASVGDKSVDLPEDYPS